MEKEYFISLNTLEKIDFVWNYGEIINEIKTNRTYNSLFLLDSFFVEVHLDKFSNEILAIFVQENPDELYKFVQAIRLNILQHG